MKKIAVILFLAAVVFCGCGKEEKQKIGEVKISANCLTILDNLDKISDNTKSLLPYNGIVIEEQTVFLYEGDSVLSLIERVCDEQRVELYYKGSRNSAYVAGIGGIIEFDAGAESGWNYKMNGEVVSVGVSEQEINDGDVIEFVYTCALGNDIV